MSDPLLSLRPRATMRRESVLTSFNHWPNLQRARRSLITMSPAHLSSPLPPSLPLLLSCLSLETHFQMTAGERRRKLRNKARRDSEEVQNLGLGKKKPINGCVRLKVLKLRSNREWKLKAVWFSVPQMYKNVGLKASARYVYEQDPDWLSESSAEACVIHLSGFALTHVWCVLEDDFL